MNTPISILGIYDSNIKSIYTEDNSKIEEKRIDSNEYEWSDNEKLTDNKMIVTSYNNDIIDTNTRDNTNSFDSDSEDSVTITKDQQSNDLKRDRVNFEENKESIYTETSKRVQQPLVRLKTFVTIKDLIKRRSDYFSRLELAFSDSTRYDCTIIESIIPSEEESMVIHLFEKIKSDVVTIGSEVIVPYNRHLEPYGPKILATELLLIYKIINITIDKIDNSARWNVQLIDQGIGPLDSCNDVWTPDYEIHEVRATKQVIRLLINNRNDIPGSSYEHNEYVNMNNSSSDIHNKVSDYNKRIKSESPTKSESRSVQVVTSNNVSRNNKKKKIPLNEIICRRDFTYYYNIIVPSNNYDTPRKCPNGQCKYVHSNIYKNWTKREIIVSIKHIPSWNEFRFGGDREAILEYVEANW